MEVSQRGQSKIRKVFEIVSVIDLTKEDAIRSNKNQVVMIRFLANGRDSMEEKRERS